ncbi:hypothetical protein FNH22_03865 [Fulvivirga sp. M361]|uniref:hypothetical protein n=1 Tax=Fulvivirga sp. M361 TaxID=2594266 RepID=UPI00117BBB44|nr:hypothetical protein [Fulvivirga sp. M361]TRX61202.1 hypothetical protein FNH22_03865 [Fulvivirga sp. M361]
MKALRKYSLGCLMVWGWTMFLFESSAQDLEAIGKSEPLKINGGLSITQIAYGASGITNRRDPFSYFLSGNLNVNFFGINVPLSFTYSDQNSSFQQPFNQFGIAPRYKWLTGYLGYNSLTYSQYTLNGHIFLGMGLEAKPAEKWSFGGMYGRLLKAVPLDTLSEGLGETPTFQRMGYGFNARYGDNSNHVQLILFHAEDDINSLPFVPEQVNVLPEENLVLSVRAVKTIAKRLSLQGEFATSAITRDTRAETFEPGNIFNFTDLLFTSRTSSSYYNAFNFGANYRLDKYAFGMKYERVDPGYRTHGAYFFNNDLENITANVAARLFKDAVNVAISAGTQQNNLENNEINDTRRWIGSVNCNANLSNNLSINASYSTFRTFMVVRSDFEQVNQLTPFDNLDTLNFTQISQNANLNTSYIFGKGDKNRQLINVNLSYQGSTDDQGEVDMSKSNFYNLNTAYNLNLLTSGLSLTAALNANRNETATIDSYTLGSTLGINKSLFNRRVRTTLSGSFNQSYVDDTLTNEILTLRGGVNYATKSKHNFNLNMILLNNKTENTESPDFTEYTATLTYNYNF